MLVTLDAKAFNHVRAADQLHRFPMTRTQLDGNNAGRHGVQITRLAAQQ